MSGEDNVWADLLTRWGSAKSSITRSSLTDGASALVDSANDPNKLRSVACPNKPRHVCPENNVDVLPSRKRAYAEFAGIRPLHQSEFVWPDIIEIQALQQKYTSADTIIPDTSVDKAGIIRDRKQAIWVPQEATSLQLRLMVIAHSACAGHRGINATRHALQERFFWAGMYKSVT